MCASDCYSCKSGLALNLVLTIVMFVQITLAESMRREEYAALHAREAALGEQRQQVQTLLALLYFARLFDLSANENTLWGKQMECQACISYEYADPERVANDRDLLTMEDLSALASMGDLITTRPQV